MQVKLPVMWSLQEKYHSGVVRQILHPEISISVNASAFVCGKVTNARIENDQGETLAYVCDNRPQSQLLPKDAPAIVFKGFSCSNSEADLSSGEWIKNAITEKNDPKELAKEAHESWRGAFNFVQEDESRGIMGLRKPQIGALHAIHAHWATSSETATIVMPTGTGKTETMLSTLISARCERVLVIVPTDALREQLAGKFETLGVLKIKGHKVLDEKALRPVVGTIFSKPKTPKEVQELFERCNVIVTTSHLAGTCDTEIQQEMAKLCTHLFIDEAHHAEAATWRAFREIFRTRHILQFTATPFREDGKKVDGKLIFAYPLKQAQEDGYFKPILFHRVREFNIGVADKKIALAALDELDRDTTKKHIVMARVANIRRAEHVHKLYTEIGRYEAVLIHSQLKATERAEAKQKLMSGAIRVVVCVDMLGEGFDLPELKIAAFHDIRKSLAVTLQLAGRFTRARPDLGDPVFIANIALIDVREELQKLYSQDSDWNSLLPALSQEAIAGEQLSQEFFKDFTKFLSDVPLKDIRPAASMVVYRTECANWTPKKFKKAFSGLSSNDKLYHSLNEVKNSLVLISAIEQQVRWSDVKSVSEYVWELFVAVWDRDKSLLYLHGSNNSSEYHELAKALCDGKVELVKEPEVWRVFSGVKRLVMNNVGLNEHLGRQVRYTGRMGSDVESRLGTAVREGATRAVLAGKGFENGQRTSVGASRRGRVWANLRLRVDEFSVWAKEIGEKISDVNISPDEVLAGTLKPIPIGVVPGETPIAVDWPQDIYEKAEHLVTFHGGGTAQISSTDVDLLVKKIPTGELIVSADCDVWSAPAEYRLELFPLKQSFDFRFVHHSGPKLNIQIGTKPKPLDEYFTKSPPIVWFSDGSSLEGCMHTRLPILEQPYPVESLKVFDWTGVDLKKESQKLEKRPDSIQFAVIRELLKEPKYSIIFDDDGSGEAADVVTIALSGDGMREWIEVELYHLKYTDDEPGARVDDLYVVCGQAQRSVIWLANDNRKTELFTHLLRREQTRINGNRPSRFERGNENLLHEIREKSRILELKLKAYVVQPGLSKAKASATQLRLLAVTERFLSDTYEVPFSVICSA
ncbi:MULTISPECIES: DEAD/DEAH box helicase [Comamonas]|uniref:DEAD/DEAH box helicase n=1 Tax=Comamonas TaxID=283 RepID=UPI000552CE29|nr:MULTISPECIES: DEAD/DEAH box helicase family protein [Comamonas]TZG12396.1 DEAD/DEAH box helicase [Comamonas thiooxydans]UNV90185.1 DEAD/DEAH box helicase family protein [Comamonas sp. 7D-2evo1]UNV96514.1 DEAD/DEAH box helicase family protein [Comamonas sp. 7D-2]UNV99821.1 DEAD/DEAH box helicase family protein [Comamonas sp. 7D-2evo2]